MSSETTSPPPALGSASALQAALEWWEDSGVDIPPIIMPKPARAPRPALGKSGALERSALPRAASASPIKPSVSDDIEKLIASATAIARAAPTLDALKSAMEGFDAGDMMAGATQTVFARGNPKARLMLMGESPGKEEDAQGQPFIGKAGQLLGRMLAAIGLSNDDVYIANICHFRPLNFRAPSPQEIAVCLPFARRHIELANPQILVMAGRHSLEALTGEKGITKLRGQWMDYAITPERMIAALPLYHPAFLMRRPELKADAWRDLLALKARLDSL